MKRFVVEIEKALAASPQRTSSHVPEDYIGGRQSHLRFLGIRVPDLRASLKAGFSFSDSDREEQAKIWDYVWHHSDCYEVMSLALGWYEHKKQADLLVKDWPKLKKWSVRVDNWAHSDSLSGLYARILEGEPSLVYPAFETWNRSKNPWLRRLSIVSLLYYSSQRKSVLPFKEIISLIEPQIEFDHYYVQKGVGWALRETGNVYPAETYQFLEGNVRRLSAAAFSAATEKITKTRKDRLKRLRKG